MTGQTHPARLLLVEDSETQALQLSRLLRAEGFVCNHVPSAEAALERLGDDRPDLLIVDFRLPGMNGDELARTVRLSGALRSLPILMLTEERGDESERLGLDSGANAYVPKSGDPKLLVARIRALLRSQAGAGAEAPFVPRRTRMLLIDDGAPRRLLLANLLEGEGYAVTGVGDPAAAREASAQQRPDVVLVALDAHGFDGVALCRELDAARAEDSDEIGRAHV